MLPQYRSMWISLQHLYRWLQPMTANSANGGVRGVLHLVTARIESGEGSTCHHSCVLMLVSRQVEPVGTVA